MPNLSTLQDIVPAHFSRWTTGGKFFVYELSLTDAGSANSLTIRDSVLKKGCRQYIVGWLHSASFDHKLTFELGPSFSLTHDIRSGVPFGTPIAAHGMLIGREEENISVYTDVATEPIKIFCALAEVGQASFS